MAILGRLRRSVQDTLQRVPGGRMVWRGPGEDAGGPRRVALTFDDGPDEHTERYLDVLDAYGVPATFFVMGDLLELRPGAIAQYLRRGHQLGGHGYDHTRFDRMTPRQLVDQLARSERLIGPVPQGRLWVRPPYGAMGPVAAATMLARGHVIAMWSFDSKDYEEAPPDTIVARCAPGNVVAGDVLLFHEGNTWTPAALPGIIEGLRGAGFELVTMADLVAR